MKHFPLIFLLFFMADHVFCQIDTDQPRLITAPDDPEEWDDWRNDLIEYRKAIKEKIDYVDSLYEKKEFQWAARCHSVYFLMLFDRAFYDPGTGSFMVDEFVAETEEQFGPIDGIVLWHAYPRIGFDLRNQFDHYREFPGGLKGLKEIVDRFHEHGIKVFIDYNPWDTGTRREGRDDIYVLTDLLTEIGADGIFLDTLTDITKELRGLLDSAGSGMVLESELALPVERLYDHHMSWAQWFDDSHVPGILRNKWIERRHMMHQIKRWNSDHSSELQMAWMNGSGMLVWENVFGSWMSWNDRDKSYLRMMNPLLRYFNSVFTGEGWQPLYKTERGDVYASLWHNENVKIWTLVNRGEEWVHGEVISIPLPEGEDIYDLMKGEKLDYRPSDNVPVKLDLPPRGLGCILVLPETLKDKNLSNLIKNQKERYSGMEISTYANEAQQELKEMSRVQVYKKNVPPNMALIDDPPDSIRIAYMQRECGFYDYQGYVHPPDRNHQIIEFKKAIDVKPYAIDLTPVTNMEFFKFMKASGYRPEDTASFLSHWENGQPGAAIMDHPVVYVNLKDARAYAEWKGKRLPTEEEWQIAAQGREEFNYPWGDSFDADKCNSGDVEGTTPVKQYEEGRSPYGCYDMCGNTWELTESQRSDGHTTFCILKGGSWFEAEGSDWYAQGGPQPASMSAKYILFWPGLDRSATIGFRCVVDIGDE